MPKKETWADKYIRKPRKSLEDAAKEVDDIQKPKPKPKPKEAA